MPTPVVLTTLPALKAAMILRLCGSWPIAFQEAQICDRYARQINEKIRDKNTETMRPIHYKPNSSPQLARMDYRSSVRTAVRLRNKYRGSGETIRIPVSVVGGPDMIQSELVDRDNMVAEMSRDAMSY